MPPHLEPEQLGLHGPQASQQQVKVGVGRLGEGVGVEACEGSGKEVVLQGRPIVGTSERGPKMFLLVLSLECL